jgi:hypothetical protein
VADVIKPALVDHVVINVLYDMDAAVDTFGKLGFCLTPRGYHSLGSINHLMMFERDYLELVGLPAGTDKLRREVADSPMGLNGLVFLADDADAQYAQLTAAGIPAEVPMAFGRPVEIDGVEQMALFRTVRLKPGYVQGGRVYFCEQRTRQFVWRREWQDHPNGTYGIAGFTSIVADPHLEAQRYAGFTGGTVRTLSADAASVSLNDFTLDLVTAPRYLDRYGDFAFRPEGRDAYMGAVTLRTHSLEKTAGSLARARDAGIRCRITPARAKVAASSAFNTVIEFIEEAI